MDIEADWSNWLGGLHGELPLDEALHRIAREEGSAMSLKEVTDTFDLLAEGVEAEGAGGRPNRLDALLTHLFHEQGFRGEMDEYDHPRNSRIDLVLQRKRGLPILLCAVTLEVARRLGVELVGVGFPGHYLVSTVRPPRRFFDPFHRGRECTPAELAERLPDRDPGALGLALAPTGTRDLLVRVSSNLVGSWMRRGQPLRALDHADRRVALRPDVPEYIRDRGWMRIRVGLAEAGAFDLARYLDMVPDAEDASALRWTMHALTSAAPTA